VSVEVSSISALLLLVSAALFDRLYHAKSVFSRSLVFVLLVIAVLPMLVVLLVVAMVV
jgi:hypothetical protein